MMSMMCACGVVEYMDGTREEPARMLKDSLKINLEYLVGSRINEL